VTSTLKLLTTPLAVAGGQMMEASGQPVFTFGDLSLPAVFSTNITSDEQERQWV